MAKRDYYEVLGLSKGVGGDELKKAFRRLAIEHHPDKHKGDKEAEERFKEINEAYQVLSDPQKREAYDRFGHAGVGAAGGAGGFGFGGGAFSDIFDNIFGDIFGGQGPARGVDLRYDLEISFEEAAFGAEKEINFEKNLACKTCSGSGAKPGTRPVACQQCSGTGQVRLNQGFFTLTRTCVACMGRGAVIKEKCSQCRGSGSTKSPHKVKVTIPAGIDSEQRLRLRGEGESAEPGGRAGDLFVVVTVKAHPLFQRQEEHVILQLPITFVQAALGTKIEIPTLRGTEHLTIPAGTQQGDIFRLRGKGLKRLNGSGYGDEIISVLIEIPKRVSSKQKELLRQYEQESSTESHPLVNNFLKKFKELFA